MPSAVSAAIGGGYRGAKAAQELGTQMLSHEQKQLIYDELVDELEKNEQVKDFFIEDYKNQYPGEFEKVPDFKSAKDLIAYLGSEEARIKKDQKRGRRAKTMEKFKGLLPTMTGTQEQMRREALSVFLEGLGREDFTAQEVESFTKGLGTRGAEFLASKRQAGREANLAVTYGNQMANTEFDNAKKSIPQEKATRLGRARLWQEIAGEMAAQPTATRAQAQATFEDRWARKGDDYIKEEAAKDIYQTWTQELPAYDSAIEEAKDKGKDDLVERLKKEKRTALTKLIDQTPHIKDVMEYLEYEQKITGQKPIQFLGEEQTKAGTGVQSPVGGAAAALAAEAPVTGPETVAKRKSITEFIKER